ncbi:ABC transporter ATP-binding protein [Arsenicicoccus bolidensis]|uniref:Dipeptide ABC transporter ATP-binding protein n=3 Tax=Arsenicicoccus TaxID=267408 RepID=A0ABS9Q708_9MICO|nr:dipeptide ABC transporter ATP-binding protein [Arsenicicoccus bolidensis]MCG7323648.1 dipeptide ABC transporter ATP-binding protein [Arsenicicoccus bolidensis]
MAEPILVAKDLVKHYPIKGGILRTTTGQVKAVDGVSFELLKGETLGIVGESGCGKSTLGRLLMRLEEPTSGTLDFDGIDMYAQKGAAMRKLRRDIQIVFQDPYTSLNPRKTVGDIVGEPFDIHPDVVPKSGRRKAVQDLLDLVGLNPEHINRYPHQFSGGQRQRIGIARGIALNPKVLICDEPVSALDVSVQAQVVNLMEKLQTELGLSYIFIAHDLSVVRHISDRVGVMYLGKMVELGTEDEIYERTTHPYTQALMSAVPVPDPTLRGKREQIVLQGDVPSPANPPAGCRFHTRCWKMQEICKTEVPEFIDRPDGFQGHRSACHFPEVLVATGAEVDSDLPGGTSSGDGATRASEGQGGLGGLLHKVADKVGLGDDADDPNRQSARTFKPRTGDSDSVADARAAADNANRQQGW